MRSSLAYSSIEMKDCFFSFRRRTNLTVKLKIQAQMMMMLMMLSFKVSFKLENNIMTRTIISKRECYNILRVKARRISLIWRKDFCLVSGKGSKSTFKLQSVESYRLNSHSNMFLMGLRKFRQYWTNSMTKAKIK